MSGIVVDSISRQPLSGVKISVYISEKPEISQSTHTGADGRFAFTGLPAGKYTLIGSAPGYRAQGPHQRGNYFIGVAVGPNLDSESIVFRLVRDARIEGTITDDDGEPVRNSNVALYQRTHEAGRQQTQQVSSAATDDRGHYLFSHLAPGTYFVAVSARPWYAQYPNPGEPAPDAATADRIAEERAPLEVAYPMTFYPSAEESSSATPIVLQAGDRVTADIAVRAVPAVHLRVRTGAAEGTTSGNGFPRVSQRIFEGTLVPVMSSQGYSAGSGVYEYTGIAPGHYVIEMPDASAQGPRGLVQRDGHFRHHRTGCRGKSTTRLGDWHAVFRRARGVLPERSTSYSQTAPAPKPSRLKSRPRERSTSTKWKSGPAPTTCC